jgi:ATP-dependent DNA helicase Rep
VRVAAARSTTRPGVSIASEKKSLLEVAQTISLLSTLDEREQDPNM